MKLHHKLYLLIVGLTILSLALPSGMYYLFSKAILKRQVDDYLQAELSKYSYEINGWINTESQTVITISDIIKNMYQKKEITSNLLKSYLSDNNISDIYIGLDNGDFISGKGWKPGADFDPRTRPWYVEAMKARKLNISHIYYDLSTKQYAIAIGVPLRDKSGNIIGVLSEDILLNTIFENIHKIQLKNMGYACLLDSEGTILAHRDKSFTGKKFSDLTGNDMNRFNEPYGNGSYVYRGKTQIVVYRALTSANWKLVLVVDKQQAYQPLNNLLVFFIINILVTIGIAFLLTGLFNRSIIRRLKLLSDASAALSQGDFDIEISDLGKDEVGEVSRAFSRMKSEIKAMVLELDSSRMKYEELIENMIDVIFSVDTRGCLITANTAFFNLFQLERKDLEGRLFVPYVRKFELGGILTTLIEEVMREGESINEEIESTGDHYYNITLTPIYENNRDTMKGVTVILHDTSDFRRYRNHLEWITHHDALTQLPNRFKLMEDMDTVLLKARTGRQFFAVLFIDLDDFKNINDTLGYASGDIVLQKTAQVLTERHTVYRIGADEFALILDRYDSILQLHEQVEEISKLLNRSFDLGLNTVYNSATIGVSVYPKDFDDISEMMIRTDAALNYAKENGNTKIQFYEYSISYELQNRVILEKGLREALDRGEFELYYQPIMDGTCNAVKGFEALIRWRKEDGKVVPPGEFMPIAENMAIIHNLGFWIISQALKDLKTFQDAAGREFTMAVNLSANQIKLPDFGDRVVEIIKQQGVNPRNIEFEITESILIESIALARKQFQTLIDFGAKISLDDFGTGYSSLNYLQYFPFQIIKIDKSFISYVTKDTISKSLVKHIIEIAHGLSMEIIAEGVENEFQKEYLRDRECDYFQGYLFSKPIPKQEVLAYLKGQEGGRE